jgi:choline-phosphate cytidylyltransferase
MRMSNRLRFRPLIKNVHSRSEEDNDPLTDDNTSGTSILPVSRIPPTGRPVHQNTATPTSRFRQAVTADNTTDSGVESPMYDGDVESSATAGPDSRHHISKPSIDSALTSPVASAFPIQSATMPQVPSGSIPLSPGKIEPPPGPIAEAPFDPASLTPENIQTFVTNAILDPNHAYKINPPPVGRPIRVYADGKHVICSIDSIFNLITRRIRYLSFWPRSTVTTSQDVFPLGLSTRRSEFRRTSQRTQGSNCNVSRRTVSYFFQTNSSYPFLHQV